MEQAIQMFNDKLNWKSSKGHYLFNPEETDESNRVKDLSVFEQLEDEQSEIKVIVTWKAGIRGINYWKQCVPIACFPIDCWTDYK